MVATSISRCWIPGLTQPAMVQWSLSVFYQFAGPDYALLIFSSWWANQNSYNLVFQSPKVGHQTLLGGGSPHHTHKCTTINNIGTAQWIYKIGDLKGMHPWWQLQFPFVDLQASHSQPWSSGLNLFSISLQDWTLQDLKFSSWWVNQNL